MSAGRFNEKEWQAEWVKRGRERSTAVRQMNLALVLELVMAAPPNGISISAVVKASGLCMNTVGDCLRAHRKAGLIDRSHYSGPGVRWGRPGIAHQYAKSSRKNLERVMPITPLPVRQVVVSANEAKPVKTQAPNSVWALGRAA